MRSDEIALAARLLTRVLRGDNLEVVIHRHGGQAATPRITAWLYGSCRHFFSLSEQLTRLCHIPLAKLDYDVLAVLLLGAYQLIHSDAKRHAIVSESVAATTILRKSAAGLVNAVLRKIDTAYEPETTVGQLELPDWFIAEFRATYGESLLQQLAASMMTRAPLSLRVNQTKIDPMSFQGALWEQGIAFVELYRPSTIRLCKPRPIASIPGYAEGWFAVQDANAQLAVHALQVEPGMHVLDACAAPGNKTLQLLERAANLTALDADASRGAWLKTESQRLGMQISIETADATTRSWWDGEPFDRILIDAPCSATGTIARHPDVKMHRAQDQLPLLANLQERLLNNLWELLSENGLLVYCTCSLLRQENEYVISEFIAQHRDVQVEAISEGAPGNPLSQKMAHGVQLFPDPNWGDGFYVSKLRKLAA